MRWRWRGAARRIRDLVRSGRTGYAFARLVTLLREGELRAALGRLLRPAIPPALLYERWMAARALTPAIVAAMRARIAERGGSEPIAILLPVDAAAPDRLAATLRSIEVQIDPRWRLAPVVDDRASPEILAVLGEAAGRDARIAPPLRLAGIRDRPACLDAAFAATDASFVALCEAGDALAPHALFAASEALRARPDTQWLYADEDRMDASGRRTDPVFKPDWSPAYALTTDYPGPFAVLARSFVVGLGGFEAETRTGDFAIRAALDATRVVHVADVLCHRGPTPTRALAAAGTIHFRHGLLSGEARPGPVAGTRRITVTGPDRPLVSLAIPSAGKPVRRRDGSAGWYVLDLVRSIRDHTIYAPLEIVVADNPGIDPALAAALDGLDVRRVRYAAAAFNLSDKMNLTVAATTGAFVVLLNDDMTPITPDWIDAMLTWCRQPGVAAVGAKLLFPNGRIQHAGIVLLEHGPSHLSYNAAGDEPGLALSGLVAREYAAVTGACLMLRRADYEAVGGFDPGFRINYNDVDFCLRLAASTGGRIVWTPEARLIHHESVSREAPPANELRDILARYPALFGRDPAYSPHLSQTGFEVGLRPDILSLAAQYGLDPGLGLDPEAGPESRAGPGQHASHR